MSCYLSIITGTSTGGCNDFSSEQFIFSFGVGDEGNVECSNISINNNRLCEEDKFFQLVLESGPDGGTVITNSPGMIVILDDDGEFATS